MGRATALAGLVLSACAAGPASGEFRGGPKVLALVGVNVVPMDRDTVLTDRTVIVSGGIITTIGAAAEVEVPSGAEVVQGNGRYLLPGLVDAHVHLSDTRSELAIFVGYGVTTIFEMGTNLDDVASILALRQSIEQGDALGPALYAAGPLVDGEPPIVPGRSVVVRTPEEAERAVARLAAQGVDFVKVYNRVSPEALVGLGESTREAGLPLVGHIPREAGAIAAIEAGMDMVAHAEEFFFTYFGGPRSTEGIDRSWRPEVELVPDLVDHLLRGDVWVTPNLSFLATNLRRIRDPEGFREDPDVLALDPGLVADWRHSDPHNRNDLDAFSWREEVKYELVRTLTAALQSGGVPLLLGTDSSLVGVYPGRSAHLELREMVAAGLTPFEALATGTARAGEFVRTRVDGSARFGTVVEGARADLLLIEGDPLADIRNVERIAGLVLRGRWVAGPRLAELRKGERGWPPGGDKRSE